MTRSPTLSLIVPTRGRPAPLRRFLDSLAATTSHPEGVEIVLVVDADDPASVGVRHRTLAIRHVVVPPGQTMGALNAAGYEASTGEFVMLLNDDVVVRTSGWDARTLACLRRFSDSIVLVHVNDTLFRDKLCTFPLTSRVFCELAGGVCPKEYVRYRIDDHIEDVFNLLAVLGERRTVYLPDVVFQHLNTVERPEGDRVYASDPDILALDAPRFDALFPARKEFALRLLDYMEGGSEPAVTADRRRLLDGVADSETLRAAGRQWVVRSPWWRRAADRIRRPQDVAGWAGAFLARVRGCVRNKGWSGLARAVARRLALSGASSACPTQII